MPHSSRRGQKNGKQNGQQATRLQQNKTKFPSVQNRLGTKLTLTAKLESRADRTRENKGIYLPVPLKGRREMYMRPQRPNHGSSLILL